MRISDWSSDVCSSDLITAAVEVMRELVTPVHVEGLSYLVDIVGTGGDGANLFNVSSGAAFVAAAAGDWTSDVSGQSVSVRLDLGGRRINNNNTHSDTNKARQQYKTYTHTHYNT